VWFAIKRKEEMMSEEKIFDEEIEIELEDDDEDDYLYEDTLLYEDEDS
jgi:hypothetical protein